MYQRILVPLDGSERAEAILSHIEALAGCNEAELVLMSVVDPPVTLVGPYDVLPTYSMDDVQQQMHSAESYLLGVSQRLEAKGLHVRVVVEYGAVVAAIIEVAAREGADIIAMASHGRTGLARVFYGSVAAGVLQRIDRPLLLVRA